MKRLLIYVHFNKYDHISRHVFYQIEHMRPLFEKLIFLLVLSQFFGQILYRITHNQSRFITNRLNFVMLNLLQE